PARPPCRPDEPTPRAPGSSVTWVGSPIVATLDLEEFGFFVAQQLVDLVDVRLGERLELLLGAARLVLAYFALAHHPVQGLLGVPPHAADRHPRTLGLVSGQPDVVTPALLGERR